MTKSKIEAVQSHPLNNKIEIRVFRNNRTARIYTAYYTDYHKAFRLGLLFSKLIGKLTMQQIKERAEWWVSLNDQN